MTRECLRSIVMDLYFLLTNKMISLSRYKHMCAIQVLRNAFFWHSTPHPLITLIKLNSNIRNAFSRYIRPPSHHLLRYVIRMARMSNMVISGQGDQGGAVAEWVRALDWRPDGPGFESHCGKLFASELWQFRLPRFASVFRRRH